jgi:prepilin-type N-terminal cleavage/methylation domain-containing protein
MMPCAKREELPAQTASFPITSHGFSLVELLVTMVIFGILMTGIFQAYIAQMKNTTREYGIAESDIDRSVGQGVISRDIFMAGYGLADDYNGVYAPWALQSTNSDTAPDDLTLMGTALGMDSQQAQHWSYVTNFTGTNVTLRSWADSREDIEDGDNVILLDAATKRLLTGTGTPNWLFQFDTHNAAVLTDDELVGWSAPSSGTVVYGLYGSGATAATQPYYAVNYHLSSAPGDGCAPNVPNLLRVESRTTEAPTGGDVIIPCVADFQVILGLDTNSDRQIDLWSNGGVTAADGYDPARLNRSLRQVRVYALTQIGERDNSYTYPSSTVYVGDQSLGRGRSFPLSTAQRHYRWRVIRFSAVPRNIR